MAGEPVVLSESQQKRFNTLMSDGHISKAADGIFRQQYAISPSLDDSAVQKLRAKHPAPSESDVIPALPANAPSVVITKVMLAAAISRADNGSAPGISGITGSMLRLLWSDEQCQKGLVVLANDIVNGAVPADFKSLLLAGRLIGIVKSFEQTDGVISNVEHRPIVMGDSFVKVVCSAMLHKAIGRATEFLSPIQLAVGVKGGSEIAVHKVQTMLELNTSWIAAKVDFVNALESLQIVLESLFRRPELAFLWRLVHFLYSQPSLLFLFDGTMVVDTILSREGVRQGDVLGPLLFCLGVHDLYSECLRVSGAQGVAIADDLTLVGKPEQVCKAFAWIADHSVARTGMQISVLKSQLFFPHDHQQHGPHTVALMNKYPDIVFKRVSLPLLGSIISMQDEVRREFAIQKVNTLDQPLARLLSDEIPMQSALVMFRYCVVSRLAYLFRTLPPHVTRAAAQLLADMINRFLVQKLVLPEPHISQTQLFMSRAGSGGLGIPHPLCFSECGYFASMASAT